MTICRSLNSNSEMGIATETLYDRVAYHLTA